MSSAPIDPISPLGEGAIQMHELVLEYQHAGFSREEALRIVLVMVTAQIRHPKPEDGL